MPFSSIIPYTFIAAMGILVPSVVALSFKPSAGIGAVDIESFRSGQSENALAASDAVVNSSGLVRTRLKDKHQVQVRQIPMQLDSRVAVATVTADGEVEHQDPAGRQESGSGSGSMQVPPPIDLTVGDEARQIVESMHSGGLVSIPRKMATANLALMALRVPGDFVETGVFNGGTAVLMAHVLKTRDKSRSLWAADSFAGLPTESEKEMTREHDQQKHPGLTAIEGNAPRSIRIGAAGDFSSSRLIFESNLQANGLGNSTTNPQIKVLAGWFNETLPGAQIQQIAFLRLDGDIYASTMDALTSLYDKVVPGGYIYVDDYGSFIGCANAINDFRKHHGITEVMHPVSEGAKDFEALWWQKAPLQG